MNDDGEVLDLVDKNDVVVGTILRSQISQPGLVGFVRAAEAFIQNSDGKLWIPRRQPHKKIAPGGLDYSMGEHVGSGETYLLACIRGFKEELRLNIQESDLRLVKKFAPSRNLDYFRTLYIYKADKPPNFNRQDFSEYFWLSPNELLDKLKAGEPAKQSLLETVRHLVNS